MDDAGGDRFEGYVEALAKALGHADRAAPFRWYTTGLLLPLERKSVEPIASRVDPGRVSAAHQSLHHFVAQADWSDDAVLAARARAGRADHRDARADRSLDRRRHRLPQEGQAFGRCGAPILRPARQAGQLPGRGQPVGGKRRGEPGPRVTVRGSAPGREPEGRVSALSAEGVGRGPGQAGQSGRARSDRLRDQADDRARSDRGRLGRGRASRRGARGCRWSLPSGRPRAGPRGRGYEVAGRPARAGAGVRRRRATAGQNLDRRQGALARQAVAGSRTAADQPAARAGPPTRRRQGVGERSAARSLAGRDLARGDPGRACACARRIGTTGATRPGPSSGCWSKGPRARPSRPNTGSRTYPPPHHSSGWSISPSCAGGPCAIIWS
jgi:hypothetical protein